MITGSTVIRTNGMKQTPPTKIIAEAFGELARESIDLEAGEQSFLPLSMNTTTENFGDEQAIPVVQIKNEPEFKRDFKYFMILGFITFVLAIAMFEMLMMTSPEFEEAVTESYIKAIKEQIEALEESFESVEAVVESVEEEEVAEEIEVPVIPEVEQMEECNCEESEEDLTTNFEEGEEGHTVFIKSDEDETKFIPVTFIREENNGDYLIQHPDERPPFTMSQEDIYFERDITDLRKDVMWSTWRDAAIFIRLDEAVPTFSCGFKADPQLIVPGMWIKMTEETSELGGPMVRVHTGVEISTSEGDDEMDASASKAFEKFLGQTSFDFRRIALSGQKTHFRVTQLEKKPYCNKTCAEFFSYFMCKSLHGGCELEPSTPKRQGTKTSLMGRWCNNFCSDLSAYPQLCYCCCGKKRDNGCRFIYNGLYLVAIGFQPTACIGEWSLNYGCDCGMDMTSCQQTALAYNKADYFNCSMNSCCKWLSLFRWRCPCCELGEPMV